VQLESKVSTESINQQKLEQEKKK
jgi:hypothetical protein